jgi:tetratricopeptide (TPR) repeat protein
MSTEDLTSALQAQTLLANGDIDDLMAVAALRIASTEKIDLELALDKIKNVDLTTVEGKQKELAKTLEEIAVTEQTDSEHRDLAALCLKAGELSYKLNSLVEAERLCKRSMYISERSFGKNHVSVSRALGKLNDVYIKQNKFTDAEPLAWRAIQIAQDQLGNQHLETAEHLHRMARIQEGQMRFVEAEQYYLLALRIREKQLGPDHPELVDQLRQMASFWAKQGKRSEKKRIGELLVDAGLLQPEGLQDAAQQAQKMGVPLGQFLLGMQNLNPEFVRAGLQAQLLIADGVVPTELAVKAIRICAKKSIPFDEALEFIGWTPDSLSTGELKALLRAADELVTAEQNLGANHCGVAVVCMRLGDSYLEQKRFPEAEANYKRSLGILEKFFGPKDPEVAGCLIKLGKLYLLQNRIPESEPIVWRALEIQQKELGQDHVEVAITLEVLGSVKTKQFNHDQAEMFFKSALATYEKLFGGESPKLITFLERLTDNQLELDKFETAEQYCIRLIDLLQKKSNGKSLDLANGLDRLVRIYVAREEAAKAAFCLKKALEVRETELGKDNPDLAKSLEFYAGILKRIDHKTEAAELETRARAIRSGRRG